MQKTKIIYVLISPNSVHYNAQLIGTTVKSQLKKIILGNIINIVNISLLICKI